MDIIKFRPSKDADEKALEEAENKQQDQRLAEEFRATAKELEARALARQPQTELPAEDAQAMLDRMLAQIHADPELHKRAEQLVEVPESTGENGKGSDGKMDREASVPTVHTENDEEADMEELIRLGRALKNSGKTLEDVIGKEAAQSSSDKDKRKRRRWRKSARIFIGAAASAAVVLIVSINSNAMRMYWVEKLGWLLGNKPVTTVNNDEEHFSEDREYTETEALDLVKNELGIQPLYFLNVPERLEYASVYVDEDAQWAKMFYTYEEKNIIILMDRSDKDMSFGVIYDGDILSDNVETIRNLDVEIVYIQRDKTNFAYCATFNRENVFYQIIADMPKSTFDELIKNMEFW